MAYTKQNLIDEVATTLDMDKKAVEAVYETMLDKITAQVAQGEGKVTLTGFGTFERRHRKERTGVKPGTSQKIQIPATDYPAFKAGKNFKEAVSA